MEGCRSRLFSTVPIQGWKLVVLLPEASDAAGRSDRYRGNLFQLGPRETVDRAGDIHGGNSAPILRKNRSRDADESLLEFLEAPRIALLANRTELDTELIWISDGMGSESLEGAREVALNLLLCRVGKEHLPVGHAVEGGAETDPVPNSHQILAINLVNVDYAISFGQTKVDRLSGELGQFLQVGPSHCLNHDSIRHLQGEPNELITKGELLRRFYSGHHPQIFKRLEDSGDCTFGELDSPSDLVDADAGLLLADRLEDLECSLDGLNRIH